MGSNAVFVQMVTAVRHLRRGRVALLVLLLASMGTPAFAQIDLAGNWAVRMHEDLNERSPGPTVVDYLGLPINEEARIRALANHPSRYSLPERQCLYYTQFYLLQGPFPLRIWSENNPLTGEIVAYKINGVVDRAILTIWMDERPRPSGDAMHTFDGFTTGTWEGTTLVTQTTHAKEGFVRRNGVPSSDLSTITMYFSRHDNVLSVTAFLEDPIYLTEPFVVSRTWQLENTAVMSTVANPCWVTDSELIGLKTLTDVPQYLPGKNPFIQEMTTWYNIPVEAVLGGAETMYPEYRKRMKDTYVPPAKCVRYCDGRRP